MRSELERCVLGGGVAVFPADGLYGLACDPANAAAIERIHRIKGRDEGKPAAKALDRAGIELNYNTVPFDPRKPFDPSGVRIGTAAVTSRGMGPQDMDRVAGWIDAVVAAEAAGDESAVEKVGAEVREFTAQFPVPGMPA